MRLVLPYGDVDGMRDSPTLQKGKDHSTALSRHTAPTGLMNIYILQGTGT